MSSWLARLGWRRWRLIALTGVLVLCAGVAYGYFSATGTGNATAATGTLMTPGSPNATPGAGTVALSWNSVTPPNGGGPVTYYVSRNGGDAGGTCATSGSPATATSCIDSGLAAGTYNYTVTAVWQSWTATSSPATNVTLTSGAASQIVLSGATTSLSSGTTRTFTATVEDAAGNTVTTGPDASIPIKFAQTTGAGSVTGLSTVPAVGGVATDTIAGQLAGPVTLQASATLSGPGLTNSNPQTFTVTAGAASQIALSGSTANLASATTRTFTATVEDAAGNTVTTGPDATTSIAFAQITGSGSVTGLGTVAAVGGVATDTITGQLVGPVTLRSRATLTGPGLTSSNTQTFMVTPGAASQIALTGSTATLASATTRTFTATIQDANGNTVTTGPDAADNVAFAQTAGAGSVTGLNTVPAVAGVATDTITGKLVGSVTLQGSATLTGPGLTNSNTQTFTVTFGTATQIALSGSTANLASATTRTFTATIQDANGNTITTGADSTDSIAFGQTAGAGSVTGLNTVPAVAGVATDTITGKLAGPVTLQANATVNGTATNSNTQTFTVIAGVPTTIAIASGSGQSASNGSAFANPLVALVTDANGNPVPGVSVTFAAPSSSASGTFAPCASNPQQYDCVATTNSSGDATSSTFTANATTGSYNVAASASGTNTVNFALSNVADVLVITSAPVSGAASSTANLGAITVQQQTTGGAPVNAGSGGETVNLSGPTGSSFAASQFGTSLTSVTIPSGSSSATFWYGNATAGTPTITASASGLVSGTQKETVTTAPVGLGIVVVGGTGTPVVHCGTPASTYACAVTGVGNAGNVSFYVTFVNSSGTQVVYSSTQASTIAETGQNPGSVTIGANQSSSNPNTLTAAHDGNSVKTSTLTFGSYTLTITVAS